MKVEDVAKVSHEANRAYCSVIGDDSQVAWEDAPEWQKQSAIAGVTHLLGDPDTGPDKMHEAWCDRKRAEGWTYAPEKDADLKTHPCLVPFAELPIAQKLKDCLFRDVVYTFLSCEHEGQLVDLETGQ